MSIEDKTANTCIRSNTVSRGMRSKQSGIRLACFCLAVSLLDTTNTTAWAPRVASGRRARSVVPSSHVLFHLSESTTTTFYARGGGRKSQSNKNNKVLEYEVIEDDEDNDEMVETNRRRLDDGLRHGEDDEIPYSKQQLTLGDIDNEPELSSDVSSIADQELIENEEMMPTQSEEELTRSSPQYVALQPGTVVQIQVGDVSLARKTWKKRRRSLSPLLVPCSILQVDQRSAIRWNLIYLLEKFGSSCQKPSKGIIISLSELTRLHRKHLKSSLRQHAIALLGRDDATPRELVETLLFPKQVQDFYGVRLVQAESEEQTGRSDTDQPQIYLQAPLTRMRAQKRAGSTALLQFYGDVHEQRSEVHPPTSSSVLHHTGVVRMREQQNEPTDGEFKKQFYSFKPLSAALRVNKRDLFALNNLENDDEDEDDGDDFDVGRNGLIHDGSYHAAVVLEYDPIGDGGMPFVVLSLDPAQARDQLRLNPTPTYAGSRGRGHNARKYLPALENGRKIRYRLGEDIKAGVGPLEGTVVGLVRGGALVDCGVGYNDGSNDAVRVLGMLRFQDAVEMGPKQSSARNMEQPEWDDEDDDENDGDESDDAVSWEEILSFGSDDEGADVEDEEEDGDEIFGDEQEEDITHLFKINENGELVYTDPESGETRVLRDDDEDENDKDLEGEDEFNEFEDEDEETDLSSILLSETAVVHNSNNARSSSVKEEKLKAARMMSSLHEQSKNVESKVPLDAVDAYDGIMGGVEDNDINDDDDVDPEYFETVRSDVTNLAARKSGVLDCRRGQRRHWLSVNETVQVYVRSVSKQSRQLLLTMDAAVQGKKAKVLKKESAVNKKLDRLAKQLGGLHRIEELQGRECDGIVKATSHTGGWLYVQPILKNVPVGVASISSELSASTSFAKDDKVRIVLNGIDEERGQLAMVVLQKV